MSMVELCDSYEEWKHCITVLCDIPLSADYVEKRIAALSDKRDTTTDRFVQLYGDAHRLRTIQWFKRAQEELAGERQKVRPQLAR